MTMLVCGTAFAQPAAAPLQATESTSACRQEIDARRYDTMNDVCAQEVQRIKAAGVAPGIKMTLDVIRAYQLSESSPAWQQRLDAAQHATPPADNERLAELNLKLGKAFLLETTPEPAIEPLARALSFGPGALPDARRIDAIGSLADALLLTGQYDRALQLLESAAVPGNVEVPLTGRLSVRKAEAYLGLLSDPAAKNSNQRNEWLQKRWTALESAVTEDIATRATHETSYGELDCIFPSAKRLPGYTYGPLARGVASIAFRMDADGLLSETRLAEASGSAEADRQAVAMGKHAQCRPNPKMTQAWMRLPFKFR